MHIEQFVMAYEVEQDRLRALVPHGFKSLRPVLRINAEIRGGAPYIEFNTAVEAQDGTRGWINIGAWVDGSFTREGETVAFETDMLRISFTGVGIRGGCPAEKDSAGCYYPRALDYVLRPAERIDSPKEFCDCTFNWLTKTGTSGQSTGKSAPVFPTEQQVLYPRQMFSVTNAAAIPCRQVVGAYKVEFEREQQ